jgi:uncharacterized protein YjbI with pentapeptide repeats
MKAEEFLEKYALGIRDFSGIDLDEANLSGAKLNGVNLSQANLENDEALLPIACIAILPFNDAKNTQQNLIASYKKR